MSKTLKNTTANGEKKNVKDIQFWGNEDTFKLISKASSEKELWMKSTKAMEIENVGCVIQVTTQQGSRQGILSYSREKDNYGHPELSKEAVINWSVAEAVTFVSGVKIEEIKDKAGNVISRKLVKI